MNEQELKEQLKKEIKQEMKQTRRKRIIIIFIIIFIITSIIAVMAMNPKRTALTESISQEQLDSYKTEITITKDNWKDYIEIIETTEQLKNEFGEVTHTIKNSVLKLKDNICGFVILKLKITNKDLLKLSYSEECTFSIVGGRRRVYLS